jgi:hypothetical protein
LFGGVERTCEDFVLNLENKPDARKVPSEEWFAELYRKLPPAHVVDDSDCEEIDEEFLRKLAWSSKKPSLLDPRVVHISHCGRCLRRLMELRNETAPSRNRPLLAGLASLAAIAIVGALFLAYSRLYTHRSHEAVARQDSSLSPIPETVDLSAVAAARGSSNEQAFATLPARTVKVTFILPTLSETGSYLVTVSKTRQPDQNEPFGNGTAMQNGPQTMVETTLHLERLDPGAYYLSTTHGSDETIYYYPLKIVP